VNFFCVFIENLQTYKNGLLLGPHVKIFCVDTGASQDTYDLPCEVTEDDQQLFSRAEQVHVHSFYVLHSI